MTDYVLVHGAWHGAWCWKRVRDELVGRKHRVFTPSLTGLADRSHLLSRDVTLETHIADVANLIQYEELENIVLVGHSYGGVVVRHVADRMPGSVACLVYLDAFVPENGKSLIDYMPDSEKSVRLSAMAEGDGWKIPPLSAAHFAVNEADAAWVDRQCTPHPLATFTTPAKLTGACDSINSIGYVLAGDYAGSFRQFYDRAKERGWWRTELACGHDVMLDMPRQLAELLLQAEERKP
jgi:pimeloyl-ACP methyl ester carboxylesterase